MNNVKLDRIIPYKLQRRVSRLIPIDDVLKENSKPKEEPESCEKNVCIT